MKSPQISRNPRILGLQLENLFSVGLLISESTLGHDLTTPTPCRWISPVSLTL